MVLLRILVLFGYFWFTIGLEMPKYLKACGEQDPNINKCALKNGNDAIPHLVKGDRHYKIPNMSPFRISLVEVDGGDSFKVEMRNLEIWGIDKARLADININIAERKFKLVLEAEVLKIGGIYKMDAKFLVLPLKGTGQANLTLYKPVLTYTQEWGLKEKSGDIYAFIKNSEITYDVSKALYNFENLFNGNEELGIQTNKILNENWGTVHSDLSSPVAKTILSVINQILENVYELIPYKYIFLHK